MRTRRIARRLYLFAMLLPALFILPRRPIETRPSRYTWTDSQGHSRTRADLDKILEEHKLWFESENHTKGRKADLSGADMRYMDLPGINLHDADLTNATLIGTNLEHSNLNGAKLIRATLNGADLKGALLFGTDLTEAVLWESNLFGVEYEPTSYPPLSSICGAANMEYMTYAGYPTALVQLRKQFQDNGFRGAERKITYALMSREAEKEMEYRAWGKSALNTAAFDWTTQYGLRPARALKIWLGVFAFFSAVYWFYVYRDSESRIGLIPGTPKTHDELSALRLVKLGASHCQIVGPKLMRELGAFYFSLVTSFSLGVWDFNFGKWVRQLPPCDFQLEAAGWARTAAAFQSIISVSLIALWVLTYFGRPFQ